MSTASTRTRTELSDGWQLRLRTPGKGTPAGFDDRPVAAVVPGTVHTDLLRDGRIDDPVVGLREHDQHWIGRSTWSYATTVAWQPDGAERVELVCEGLDTVAEVRLNGELLGATRNMHRTHRFDVTDRLREGDNDLEVVFLPVHDEVDRVRDEVGLLPATEAVHYPYVRKMACNFGWDWGPVFVTAGIWRPIALESWSTARLASVRPLATLVDTTGHLELAVDVARTGGEADLRVRVTVDGRTAEAPVDAEHGVVALDVDDVRPWWPIGFGEQARYDVSVELLAGDEVVDRAERRVGFRTVEVVEEPDAVGTGWQLTVNGQRIPVRGFNWIPDTPFPSEVDAARYARRIDQAIAANANLLRVWGGGIYESPDFYEHCDATGVLVWQDFLFACAAYPETDAFRAEVEAEAREAVAERSTHPSLVLWNGNNECTWGWHDWGWQEVLGDRPWGSTYYYETLPAIVAELDPTRPYLPGSPTSGDLAVHPNDDAQGVSHIWNVWNDEDYLHYRDREPAFVAEFGFCGPATHATMRHGVPDGELTLDNEAVVHHLRAENGVHKLRRGLAEHFPEVASGDDWLWLAQLNQARALTVGVDHLRALERCSGAVVWQLNDCWPVVSWAAVDSDERLKPLWYALRDAFAPRRVVVQPDTDGLALVAINDQPEDWQAGVVVRRVRFDGTVLAESKVELAAPATGVGRARLADELAVAHDERREVLLVDADGHGRTSWYWTRDTELAYPPAAWDTEVEVVDDGLRLRITANSFVRDLAVFPDRLTLDGRPLPADAVASDLLLTLLPGETRELTIRGAKAEHADAVVRRPVLRAVNDLPELTGEAAERNGHE
ncbi:glycoside hydrolase family 2 protein [Egicoccus halophilus]|uniref:beta-mannosidase n=1 Tax=Egicoccus halophilus TaxID=1670830 RepID=A0A8J3EVE5_9ACTN|nr:glycoside hydrolase family 2 protein [Egicoccus halophilus]GGI07956.1 beta-mannosidase [Egicoccus halophilus]